jgi:hypothetical protein
VRQLDELYPQLREEERAPAPTSTIGAPVEHLDLATVIKVSQAMSAEMVLEKLVDTIMRTAIENAGAERRVLIFLRGVERRIAAEVTTGGGTINVRLGEAFVSEDLFSFATSVRCLNWCNGSFVSKSFFRVPCFPAARIWLRSLPRRERSFIRAWFNRPSIGKANACRSL